MSVPVQNIFIKTRNGSLAANMLSGKPAFIFLHGLGGCKKHFEQAFEIEINEKYGIITVDLLGFGESEYAGKHFNNVLAIQIEAVAELLYSLKIKEITLVIHSLASGLLPGIFSYGSWPEITRLVLIEADILKNESSWSRKLSLMDDSEFNTYITRFKINSAQALRMQLQSQHSSQQIKHWSSCFYSFDSKVLRIMAKECIDMIDSSQIKDLLSQMVIPVEYIYGLESDFVKNLNEYISSFKFRFSPVPRAGHYPMLDNPTVTYSRVFNIK